MDQNSPPSLEESKVLELSGKIIVLVIIVVLIVIAVIILLNIHARSYWSSYEDPSIIAWRRRRVNELRAPSNTNRRAGLDLESLPIIVYNPNDFKDGLECSVCLCEVTQGEKARLLPECNHGFHAHCIDMWFQSHSTCPLCRNPVLMIKDQVPNSIRIDMGENSSDESSSSEDDDDDDVDDGSFHSSGDSLPAVFPTNVLVWGNQAQISSSGPEQGEAADGTSSSAGSSPCSSDIGQCGASLVIVIPSKQNYSSAVVSLSPSPVGKITDQDETMSPSSSPVMTRLKSLKRLLSKGKRVVPSACSSSEPAAQIDTHQVEQV